MFIWNYDNVKLNINTIREELIDLDARYSTTNKVLNSVRVIEESVEELRRRYNTGIRVKGRWIDTEDGHQYCSNCQAAKIQVNDNFCGNCGADMGKL